MELTSNSTQNDKVQYGTLFGDNPNAVIKEMSYYITRSNNDPNGNPVVHVKEKKNVQTVIKALQDLYGLKAEHYDMGTIIGNQFLVIDKNQTIDNQTFGNGGNVKQWNVMYRKTKDSPFEYVSQDTVSTDEAKNIMRRFRDDGNQYYELVALLDIGFANGGEVYDDYHVYKVEHKKLDDLINTLHDKLNAFPKGEMGLITNDVRKSDEYIQVKKEWNTAWKNLQDFNKNTPREFKLKAHEERRAAMIEKNKLYKEAQEIKEILGKKEPDNTETYADGGEIMYEIIYDNKKQGLIVSAKNKNEAFDKSKAELEKKFGKIQKSKWAYSYPKKTYADGGIIENELDDAKTKLAAIEKNQVFMKEVNAILRSKKDIAEKLKKIGVSDDNIIKLQEPDRYGRFGFPSYALTNNNANMKRMQDRVNMLEKKMQGFKDSVNLQEEKYAFDGGEIEVNYPIDRVQILFPNGRTDKETYATLRKNGWVYSPSNKAFQRKITPQAIRNAISLFKATSVGGEKSATEQVVEEEKTRFPDLPQNHPLNILDTDSPQYKSSLKEYENDLPELDNVSEITKEVEPIGELGSGAKIYFETEKYRVNDLLKNGNIVLNIGDENSETPMANIEFDNIEEAVFVAKKLEQAAPKGLTSDYHDIPKIIEYYKKQYNDSIYSSNKNTEDNDYQKEVKRQREQGLIANDTEGISVLGMIKGKDNPVDKLKGEPKFKKGDWVGDKSDSEFTKSNKDKPPHQVANSNKDKDGIWKYTLSGVVGDFYEYELEPREKENKPELVWFSAEAIPFVPKHQRGIILKAKEEFQDAIIRVNKAVDELPKTYDTENVKDKMIHLHYFYGNADWYIVEKDIYASKEGHLQDFGYADLGYGAELGYISIDELVNEGRVELDLYFEPKLWSEINKTAEEPIKEDVTESVELTDDVVKLINYLTTEKIPSKKAIKWNGDDYDDDIASRSRNLPKLGKTLWQIALIYGLDYGVNVGRSGTEDAIDFDGNQLFTVIKKAYSDYGYELKNIEHDFTEFDTVENVETPIIDIKPTINTDVTSYKNPYEVNRAIEALIDLKGDELSDYTSDELEFIQYYSGYGGLEKFGATGKGLLYEYFTPTEICKKMWALAYKYGYGTIGNNSVCEPSVGTGNFLKYAPEKVQVDGYEINEYSARICRLLFPKADIMLKGFEQNFIKNNLTIKNKITDVPKYSLVIGNPPYGKIGGKYMGMGEANYSNASNFTEYFIFRGLDMLVSGGLLIYIVGAEQKNGGTLFLDSQNSKVKEAIFEKAELIDAYRLPINIFERTGVSSEIIVFKKR